MLAILAPLSMFVVNIGIIGGLWLGAIKVDNGTIQVGLILAFINYLMMVMNGLMSSSMVLVQLARAMPSAERIVTVLEETTDIVNPQQPITCTNHGNVTFENVKLFVQ